MYCQSARPFPQSIGAQFNPSINFEVKQSMDHIDLMFKLLNAGKAKDSPEIVTLLETIKATPTPENYIFAKKVVEYWPQTKPATMNYLTHPATLIGGGVGLFGLASVQWLQPFLVWLQKSITLPIVQSPGVLLLIVAALGAMAGAGYSIYCQRGIMLPQFGKTEEGVLTFSRLGILNELGFGALAAATTIWLAAIGIVPFPNMTTSSDTPPTTAASVTAGTVGATSPTTATNLLSWSVVMGSLVSGWYGARMRTARLDQALLTSALAKTAVNDKLSPELEAKILTAPSAAVAATLATGLKVVGTNLPGTAGS